MNFFSLIQQLLNGLPDGFRIAKFGTADHFDHFQHIAASMG
jgi:hypothetical protein